MQKTLINWNWSFFGCTALALINVIYAAPGVTPTPKKQCKQCPLDFDPVCAGAPDSNNEREWRSFGNKCVAEIANCEKETS